MAFDRICDIFFQLLYLLLLILIPLIWINVSFYLSDTIYTFTLGIFLILESYIYLKLPIDLIPDFIPLIGKIDDFIAYIVGLFGFWIIIYVCYYNLSDTLIATSSLLISHN